MSRRWRSGTGVKPVTGNVACQPLRLGGITQAVGTWKHTSRGDSWGRLKGRGAMCRACPWDMPRRGRSGSGPTGRHPSAQGIALGLRIFI